MRIVVSRGYSGLPKLYEASKGQGIRKRDSHTVFRKRDFDPSRDNMDDHFDNAFRYFGSEDIDFQRIAVTEKQIEKFIQSPTHAQEQRDD